MFNDNQSKKNKIKTLILNSRGSLIIRPTASQAEDRRFERGLAS